MKFCYDFPHIHKYQCFNSNSKIQGITDSGGDFFPIGEYFPSTQLNIWANKG